MHKLLVGVLMLATLSFGDIIIDAGTVWYEWSPYLDANWNDVNDLNHYYAYIWKINLDGLVGEDEIITGAVLSFDDIRNWNNNPNILHMALLDITTPPAGAPKDDHIFAVYDNQNPANFFSIDYPIHYTDHLSLGSFVNMTTTPSDQSIVFNDVAVASFNSYKADNNWIGIGLDPDCHYFNNGVRLTLTTAPVPEPAILSLLGCGLLGLLFIRRKK